MCDQYWEKYPRCESEDIYQDECDNVNCLYFGQLFNFCGYCGCSDHVCEEVS